MGLPLVWKLRGLLPRRSLLRKQRMAWRILWFQRVCIWSLRQRPRLGWLQSFDRHLRARRVSLHSVWHPKSRAGLQPIHGSLRRNPSRFQLVFASGEARRPRRTARRLTRSIIRTLTEPWGPPRVQMVTSMRPRTATLTRTPGAAGRAPIPILDAAHGWGSSSGSDYHSSDSASAFSGWGSHSDSGGDSGWGSRSSSGQGWGSRGGGGGWGGGGRSAGGGWGGRR